jgi:large repetitive protein
VGNPAEVNFPSSPVQASVLNVNSQQEIQVQVNGVNVPNFSYNPQTKLVNFTASLNAGMNTVKVSASNFAGYAEDTKQIVYRQQMVIQPPVVTFVQPATSPQTVQLAAYLMKATVLNVDTKNQIQVRQNGQLINPALYAFDPGTKLVSFQTNLIEGNNIFDVTGTNQAGSDTKQAIVNFKKIATPCPPPVITFIQPAATNATTQQASYPVEIQLIGIDNSAAVQTYVNGVQVNVLTYNSRQPAPDR